MQEEKEEKSDSQFQNFIKLISRVSKIASGLKIAATIILIPSILILIMGLTYFYSNTSDLGHWTWGIPCCIMIAPILCIGVVWWVLDSITALPEICAQNSEHLISVVKHHRKTLAVTEGKRLSKIKYLTIVGKVLYGSTEVMDGVSMVAFAATPLFWILYVASFIGTIIMSIIMILTCSYHYFFI